MEHIFEVFVLTSGALSAPPLFSGAFSWQSSFLTTGVPDCVLLPMDKSTSMFQITHSSTSPRDIIILHLVKAHMGGWQSRQLLQLCVQHWTAFWL